ncbi:MAG TPA: ABC transporter substrate-binding protein [Caldilineaceae bacterium]|nr:ABC transporter substrate-binding protein [Caldilineaceae bacterium]
MRTVHKPLLLTLLLIAALLLAACPQAGPADVEAPAAGEQATGEGAAGEEPAEGAEAATEEPAAEEAAAGEAAPGVINLQLMGWASSEAENTRLQEVVDQFNETREDIQATLNLVPQYDERLQTSLAGGSPPDVFYIDSVRLPDLVSAGALEPYEPHALDPDDFYPSLRDAFTLEGTFWCPPKDFSTLALVYNPALFEQAGVEPPTAEWTWEDLQAAATAISENVDGVYGLVLPPDLARFIAFLYQAGGSIANEDFSAITINSEEALAALNFYVNLVLDGAAATPPDLDSGWAGEAFGKGLAAMAVEGNWIVPYLEDTFPDLEWGVVELPEGPAGHATMAFTVCYGVPAAISDERKAAAFELVNFLTGPEGMQAWTDLGLAMPTRQSLRDHWLEQFPDLQPFLDSAEFAHPWQFRPGFQDFIDAFNASLEQALTGAVLPEDVLAEAEQVGNDVLGR